MATKTSLDMQVFLIDTTHTLMGIGPCGTQTPEYGTHTYV